MFHKFSSFIVLYFTELMITSELKLQNVPWKGVQALHCDAYLFRLIYITHLRQWE